ncbi:MAG: DUF2177 family protein [Novosphingobium sp.]|uniref:DUF2177 family protein n=1 Tax=Novosphingobium sp. TaxID=1874826 RepID=UPI0032BD585E
MILKWFLAYIATALFFGALDAVWLRFAGPALYRPALGDLLADKFRVGPAVAFYIIYIAALTFFAVAPGLAANVGGSLKGVPLAMGLAAGIGLTAYAAYDLTNMATLKRWPIEITLIDLAWGTLASALAAGLAVLSLTKLGLLEQIGKAAGGLG